MLVPDIIIPTFRSTDEIARLIGVIGMYSPECTIIPTCLKGSAAHNRNAGLDASTSDIVIMCDDDTDGFYRGWWRDLIRPLFEDRSIIYISARLINRNGTQAPMMHNNPREDLPVVDCKYTPSACVAFWRDGTMFDEGYIGSGFEDTDFCDQLRTKNPNGRIVINNRCRIIHFNEQKNQHGEYWQKNEKRYREKWEKK